jgi:hypothetical protein
MKKARRGLFHCLDRPTVERVQGAGAAIAAFGAEKTVEIRLGKAEPEKLIVLRMEVIAAWIFFPSALEALSSL